MNWKSFFHSPYAIWALVLILFVFLLFLFHKQIGDLIKRLTEGNDKVDKKITKSGIEPPRTSIFTDADIRRRKMLEAQSQTGRTNPELDALNRNLTDSLSDDEIRRLIRERESAGKETGQLQEAARRRGLVDDETSGELSLPSLHTSATYTMARRESFRKKYKISIAHPKLLSKRYSSLFLVQIYFPEVRTKVSRVLARESEKHEITEHIQDSELETGQMVKLLLSSPGITFSESVIKKLDKSINATNFTVKPEDSCYPGTHQVILSISDVNELFEYQSISFAVKVTDFAFDHVSRPFLSRALSFAIGAGSLTMFILTLLGQMDITFGLASGTVAGILASGIYARFLSLYQQPKIANTP